MFVGSMHGGRSPPENAVHVDIRDAQPWRDRENWLLMTFAPPTTCWPSRPGRSAISTASTASSCRRRCSTRATGSGWPRSSSRRTCASSSSRTSTPDVTVAWQGGEPTMMGLDFFRRSVELVDRAVKRPQQQIQLHDPDQRGACSTEDWAAVPEGERRAGRALGRRARDSRIDIGDDPDIRVDKRGRGSFDRVMAGYAVLRAGGGRRQRVVHRARRANQDHAGSMLYRFFRDEMERERSSSSSRSSSGRPRRCCRSPTSAGETGEKSKEKRPLYVLEGNRVTDRTVEPGGVRAVPGHDLRRVGPVATSAKCLRTALRHRARQLVRRAHRAVCVFSETCGERRSRSNTTAIVYSCDHFVEPDYLLGQHHRDAARRPRPVRTPGAVRSRQARHAARVLSELRGPLRLPRRLPEEPVQSTPPTASRA